MKKVSFPYKTRMAMQVAYAAAEELMNETSFGRSLMTPTATHRFRPVLLSIKAGVFRFEGGVVVRPHLVDTNEVGPPDFEPAQQDWAVTSLDVQYYEMNEDFSRKSSSKVSERWDHRLLHLLKKKRPWWKPQILDARSVVETIHVAIAQDASQGRWFFEWDWLPGEDWPIVRDIQYYPLVEGSVEEAIREAKKILADGLTP